MLLEAVVAFVGDFHYIFFFEPFERDRGASISVHYISQLKQGSMDVVAEIVNFPCPEISVFALSTFCRGIRRF